MTLYSCSEVWCRSYNVIIPCRCGKERNVNAVLMASRILRRSNWVVSVCGSMTGGAKGFRGRGVDCDGSSWSEIRWRVSYIVLKTNTYEKSGSNSKLVKFEVVMAKNFPGVSENKAGSNKSCTCGAVGPDDGSPSPKASNVLSFNL